MISSYSTKDDINRLITKFFFYFGGIRFTFLSQKLNSAIYFGIILSNSTLATYYFGDSKYKYKFVSILALAGLFLHSLILYSGFGIMMAMSSGNLLNNLLGF